jgi:hypothetical protein
VALTAFAVRQRTSAAVPQMLACSRPDDGQVILGVRVPAAERAYGCEVGWPVPCGVGWEVGGPVGWEVGGPVGWEVGGPVG